MAFIAVDPSGAEGTGGSAKQGNPTGYPCAA
jgi:hypothetical protein